ncbi:MAG: hypothetical protein J6I64_07050 [Lachnospiraceae bacterium]|nr:hypothetical protein [Lachnospiraceae bacterium]
MKVQCIWEHNGDDTLLYAGNFPGAYTRGRSKEEALAKMPQEIMSYLRWKCGATDMGAIAEETEMEYGDASAGGQMTVEIVQDKPCDLQVCDADSDVLFDSEREPLTMEEYQTLKALVLKSAEDFHHLYESIPNKHKSALASRKTFYGTVPVTAQEMYDHTKNVNEYYFGEIDIPADNEGTIYECRKRGFEALERSEGYLDNTVIEGSYDELWSLRKVLRRFLWHDRIHARAMYRMARKTFGVDAVENIFCFKF